MTYARSILAPIGSPGTHHLPPHIHVEYQGHEALVALADGDVIEGSLPRRALVRQWYVDRRLELEKGKSGQSEAPKSEVLRGAQSRSLRFVSQSSERSCLTTSSIAETTTSGFCWWM